MAEQEQQQPEAQENKPAAPSDATQNTDTPQEQTVPYARFKEINDKLRSLEADAAKRAKEQQEADEKRLQEQQEWQKLADTRKGKIDELTPKAELAERLSAMVLEQYTAEIKEWPEQVRNMAPGDDADVLTKLDWMKRAKPLATELMGDKTPTPGNPPKPRPASSSKAEAETRAQWQRQATARYR